MISELLERWRKRVLDREMLEFRDRNVARFTQFDGSPKLPVVEVERSFVTTGSFKDEESTSTVPTVVDDPLGPPAPHVDDVQYIDDKGGGPPRTVATLGGEKIRITGSEFRKGEQGQIPTVDIGGSPATEVVWINNQTLECRSPQHEKGSYAIVVTLSNGQKSNDDVRLNYQPRPGVNTITPNSGPPNTKVVIIGYNYGVAGNSNAFLAGVKMFEANTAPGEFNTTSIPNIQTNPNPYDVSVVNQAGMQGFLRKGFTVSDAPPPPPPPPPPPAGSATLQSPSYFGAAPSVQMPPNAGWPITLTSGGPCKLAVHYAFYTIFNSGGGIVGQLNAGVAISPSGLLTATATWTIVFATVAYGPGQYVLGSLELILLDSAGAIVPTNNSYGGDLGHAGVFQLEVVS